MTKKTGIVALVGGLCVAGALGALGAPDPDRFELQVLATGLNDPMQAAPLPNGDVLFVERDGHLKRYLAAERRVRVLGQVPVKVATELGLLGMALDARFEHHQRLFLFLCPLDKPDHLRLVRGQLDSSGRLRADDLELVLEYPFDPDGAIHMGGGLAMNRFTGNLWIGTGDNCPPIPELPVDLARGGRLRDAYRTSANSMDLRGKVLRIHPREEGGYSIPDGNLFLHRHEGRPEIFAMGVRNAFRLAVDERRRRVAWGDVGPNIDVSTQVGPNGYDEVNVSRKAGNFGWPMFVGPNEAYRSFDFETREVGTPFDPDRPMNPSPRNLGMGRLPPAQPAALWYPSSESTVFPTVASGGRSAMAGPFFHADPRVKSMEKLPDDFDQCLFVYDWTRNWIQALWLTPSNTVDRMEILAPRLEIRKPIDLQLADDHSLIIVEFGDKWGGNRDGRLLRLVYRRGNRAPVVEAALEPRAGGAPLRVRFNAGNSTDPDGDEMEFQWECLGQVFKGPRLEQVFREPGEYPVTLRATDRHGASSRTTETVIVGNVPPEVSILSPANGAFFESGQAIQVQVDVVDSEDGDIDEGRVSVEGTYLGTRGGQLQHPGMALMRNTTCFSCHQERTRSVGPAYLEVSKRYQDSRENRERLVTKILGGSIGNWPAQTPGGPPLLMPPHPQHTVAEVEQMVDWIMGLDRETPTRSATGLTAEFTAPMGLDRRLEGGRYQIRARYTDQGAPGVRPFSGERVHTLHARQRRVALHEGAESVQIVDVFEGGEGLVTRFRPGSWIRLKALNLETVTAFEIRFRFFGDDPGGLECRIGSPEGSRLTLFERGESSPGFHSRSVAIESPSGLNDLFLVSRGSIEVAWIRFIGD